MNAFQASLLFGQLLLAGYLFSLILVVQRVVYPIFTIIDEDEWGPVHDLHVRRITILVAPPMLVELFIALSLLVAPPPGVDRFFTAFGALLVIVIWLSTGLIQVPLHRRMSENASRDAALRLVRTNWIRTVSWALRVLVSVAMLIATVPPGVEEFS